MNCPLFWPTILGDPPWLWKPQDPARFAMRSPHTFSLVIAGCGFPQRGCGSWAAATTSLGRMQVGWVIRGGVHSHGATPWSLDGLFHGKSHWNLDDDWGYPDFRTPQKSWRQWLTKKKCGRSNEAKPWIFQDLYPITLGGFVSGWRALKKMGV